MVSAGSIDTLSNRLRQKFDSKVQIRIEYGELNLETTAPHWLEIARELHEDAQFDFSQLIDLCGLDQLEYGLSEWDQSSRATRTGFSRAVRSATGARKKFDPKQRQHVAAESSATDSDNRFWVICHLLSHKNNWRIRLRAPAQEQSGLHIIDSLISVYSCANWYEREAYDLYGIHFRHHPDLRRLLTDYGFIGHPMRKDFPLVGEVEVHYDPIQKRVVNQPVSITPRVLVPRVIRPHTPDDKDCG